MYSNSTKSLIRRLSKKRFKTDPKSIVTFDFESTSTILVSDKTLRINIASTPVPGKHSLSLTNITSESGESFSQKMAMNIVNTPYKNMSDDEKKLFDEAAAEGDELPNDPIVSVLPHETDKYKMTYTFPPEDVELPATITITMKFFEPGDVALPATEAEKKYLSPGYPQIPQGSSCIPREQRYYSRQICLNLHGV